MLMLCNDTITSGRRDTPRAHRAHRLTDVPAPGPASPESSGATRPGGTGSVVLNPPHASRGPTTDSGRLLAPMDCHCTASYLTLTTAWGAPWPLQVNHVLHCLAYEDDHQLRWNLVGLGSFAAPSHAKVVGAALRDQRMPCEI